MKVWLYKAFSFNKYLTEGWILPVYFLCKSKREILIFKLNDMGMFVPISQQCRIINELLKIRVMKKGDLSNFQAKMAHEIKSIMKLLTNKRPYS